jgi:hypothetical protein
MSDNPLSSKVGVDTTDAKAGIATLNREIRVIESGFRATAAAMGEWDKTSGGLEARQRALTDEISLQQRKISALNGEYERIAKEKGETSRAAQDLQIKLNRETETLNKMQRELKQTEKGLDEVGDESKTTGKEVQDLGEKTEAAERKMGGFGAALSKLGGFAKGAVVAIAAVGTAALAAAAGIAGMVLKATDAAGELVDMSLKTGLSTTTLQELAYVGDQVGTGVDTITSSLARLTRSMSDTGTSKEVTAAFDTLGVAARDSNGNLRDSEVVFGELIDALGEVENETERDALAMEIFGRSAMELNPLIKAGSEEMARLTEEAHKMGAVMDADAVAGLEAFGDTLAGLKAGLMGTAGTLASAFLPGLSGLAGKAQGYLGKLVDVVQGSDGDLGEMAVGIGALLGDVFTEVGQQAPAMLEAGLGIIQGLITAIIAALPTLTTAAVTMIISLVQFIIAALPMLMQAGIDIVLALINGILPQLPKLVTTAAEMIVTLATGLAEAIPQLLPVIAEVIPQVILALVAALPALIGAALLLIQALIDGLVIALPILIEYTPQIVQAIFDALVLAFPLIFKAAIKLVETLIDGLISMNPQYNEAMVELVMMALAALQGLNQILWDAGVAIVEAIWNGIRSARDWFFSLVSEFLLDLLKAAKDAIGWHSPPAAFVELGEGMANALGIGWRSQFAGIERQITGSMEGLAGMQIGGPTFGGLGGTLNGQPAATQAASAPITINIRAEDIASYLDLRVLARMLAEEIQWSSR